MAVDVMFYLFLYAYLYIFLNRFNIVHFQFAGP